MRAKTSQFKSKIQQARAEKDAKIASLKQDAEQTQDIDAREDIYAEIDSVEKEAYEISEKTLNLPFLAFIKKKFYSLSRLVEKTFSYSTEFVNRFLEWRCVTHS